MVVGVQWFLLNADVMPGGKENRNLSLLLSLTVLQPPPPFINNLSHVQEQNETGRADSVYKEGNMGTKTRV